MSSVGKNGKIVFSDSDIAFLKSNFKSMTNKEIASALGLKITRVRTKAYELGLKRMQLEYWTPVQVQFLKDNYKTIGDTELAEIFDVKWFKQKGWTKNHIEKKRRYLNLKRTKHQLKKIKLRNTKMGRWSVESAQLSRQLRAAKTGEKRVWYTAKDTPFVVIKTKSGFVSYNRWLYKKIFGPIPLKMNVCLKPGADLINYTSQDLELLTDAELANRNSKSKLPPQLKHTQKLINQLNRIILKQSKNDTRN